MICFPKIKKIKFISITKIKIVFYDGIEGILELTTKFKKRGPFTYPLTNILFFRKMKIEDCCFMWPNGFGLGIIETYSDIKKYKICKFN